ncbi:ABC transporter permease [Lactobacillus sp. PV037]|uniref:ECF transporter S component n=1 Tax=Lactobacillus sp. PV037 TaxID=2594496 RepID=UPI00223F35DC|nr:ECF transporter S component [Lactobacillus sp. PV037]QNQ84270.1 ABC transporter permease [Lactobacillus sp. PV037]
MKFKSYTINNIIFICLLGIIWGFIYTSSDLLYNLLTLALTPVGFGPLANDIVLGLWCMAGPLTGFLIRKPGSSFLGEFLSSLMETFFMAQWGMANIISGFVQATGSEAGFFLTGYRYYNFFTLTLTATTTTIFSFAYDYFKNGYNLFPFSRLIIYFIVRWFSLFLFSAVLVSQILKLVQKADIIHDY